MDLEITTDKINDTVKVNMTGTIDISNYKQITATFEKLLTEMERHFIVDLAGVSYIDSSGLGALISCYKETEKKHGTLKIVNLSESLSKIFHLTRLNIFFHIE